MLVQSANQHHVAFTASTSVLRNASANATIVFDQVETNVGQAYDARTGIFTCPYSGNYYFSHSALSSYIGGFLETEIVLEGASKSLIYCGDRLGSTNETDYDQGSNSVVLSCGQGQRVWVQVYNYNGSTIYNEKFTQFSGFLLWTL